MNTRSNLLLFIPMLLGLATGGRAQEPPAAPRQLSLDEAVQLALKHNHLVRIAGFQVEEKQQAKNVAHSAYLPTIRNETRVLSVTDTQFIELPAGSLGTVAGTPIPDRSLILNQGGKNFVTSGTTLAQPLTQLFSKIKPANDLVRSELDAARANARERKNQVALVVRELYYRVLVTQLHRSANEARVRAAEELQTERVQQVKYGSTLEEDLMESRTQFLQAKQDLLTTELQLSDLTLRLNDAIGLPLTTALVLDPGVRPVGETCAREECVRAALGSHPKIIAAREEVRKATAGVQLSKSGYVPDVSAFARYSYQNQVPFLARNFGTFGGELTYDLFDGGRRRALVRESDARLAQAKENLARVADEVEVGVQVSYNRLERARELVTVSEELLKLRTESSRVLTQQLQQGAALRSQADAAIAREFDARTVLLQSQLDYRQARDEMDEAMGRQPGQ